MTAFKYLNVIIVAILLIINSDVFATTTRESLYNDIEYFTEREMILSQNIANIDTPGYKPKDLQKSSKFKNNINLRKTHKGHINGRNHNIHSQIIDGEIIEIKPNGNAVTAELELAKKNENNIQLQTTSNIVNFVNTMIQTAIKNN